MPKGHKRKNAGVGVDFKRAKHKVGKKLPAAQNATDTTVKARSIALPEQSIAVDKTGAVTHRNLTLKDLLGQVGHYSERVRLDALHGLTELLQKSPGEARRAAAAVVSAAAERAADADAACRAAQRDLLQKAVFPALGADALQPFIPVLMGHVCAAMTHLAEPIRGDALKLLEVIMDWRADLVASQYLVQVLKHFGDALARPTRGRSLKAGSLAALAGILAGLQVFLSKALPHVKAGGGRGSGDEGKAVEREAVVLAARRCGWPPAEPATSGAASEAVAARAVLDLLIEAWGECAPGELAVRPEVGPARAAAAVLQCCNLLLDCWGPELAGSVTGSPRTSAAAAIIEKIAPHFPVTEPAVAVAPPVREQLIAMNVAGAQLLVVFLPEAAAAAAAAGAPEPTWAVRLLGWLRGTMADGAALPANEEDMMGGRRAPAQEQGEKKGKKGGRGSEGNTAVPAAVYGAALTAVADILPLLPPPRRREMLGAAWALWERSAVCSAARARALAFFSSLLARPAETLLAPLPPAGEPLILPQEAAAWVAAMPRCLWELGTAAPATSTAALHLLLDAARFSVASTRQGPLFDAFSGLQPQLTPLFGVLMRQKGSARFVPGPLASLPPATQALAVDVLYHLPGLPEATLNTAALIGLGAGGYPSSTALRLLDVASSKATEADSSQFWGTLLTLLSGKSRSGVEKAEAGSTEGWERHQGAATAAARAAEAAAGRADALHALGPPLIEAWRAAEGPLEAARAGHGLLVLAAATASQGAVLPPAVGAALPQAALAYVEACIECAAQDPVVYAAPPAAAAVAAASAIATAPGALLGPALAAATVPEGASGPAVEASLLVLTDIAADDALEAALVEHSEAAAGAAAAVATAVENRFPGLAPALQRARIVLSQRLGKEI